jgi:hypothetical protein
MLPEAEPVILVHTRPQVVVVVLTGTAELGNPEDRAAAEANREVVVVAETVQR